jgi:hypothetical protein
MMSSTCSRRVSSRNCFRNPSSGNTMPMLVMTGSAMTAAVRLRDSTRSTAAMSLKGTASVVALTS